MPSAMTAEHRTDRRKPGRVVSTSRVHRRWNQDEWVLPDPAPIIGGQQIFGWPLDDHDRNSMRSPRMKSSGVGDVWD